MSDHSSATITVRGTVTAGYEAVRDEFAAVLTEEHNEPGAQLAVYRDGRPVVDLWAGEGIEGDSLPAVFSSTKGAAHLVVALLVQDGTLDLDRTVASYWPEFAAEGKGALTLRELLGHRSGVIGIEGGFREADLADDRVIAARLAAQAPFWEPGREYGYHALVIGALTGEVVRRATGRSIQELFEERVRAPYGLDLHLGQPAELEPRYLAVRPMNPTPEQQAELGAHPFDPKGLQAVAFNVPTDLVAWINTPSVRALGPASVGGVGSARALAGMYAATLSEFAVEARSPHAGDPRRVRPPRPGKHRPGDLGEGPLRPRLRTPADALPVAGRGCVRPLRRGGLAGVRGPGERDRVRLHAPHGSRTRAGRRRRTSGWWRRW